MLKVILSLFHIYDNGLYIPVGTLGPRSITERERSHREATIFSRNSEAAAASRLSFYPAPWLLPQDPRQECFCAEDFSCEKWDANEVT